MGTNLKRRMKTLGLYFLLAAIPLAIIYFGSSRRTFNCQLTCAEDSQTADIIDGKCWCLDDEGKMYRPKSK